MSQKRLFRRPGMRSRAAALLAGAGMVLALAPAAHAQTTVTVGTTGVGVLSGNVVQIPITATVPVQTCSNSGVAVGGVTGGVNACVQQQTSS